MWSDENAVECGSLRARLQQRGGNVLHSIDSAGAYTQGCPSVGYGLMWVDECPVQSIYPTPLGTAPYVAMGIQQVQGQDASRLQSVSAESSQAQLAMRNPFQALQNMMVPCSATQQTQEVAASSPQRSAVRITNKKLDTQSAVQPSSPKASQLPVATQTQASVEAAGQMLLKLAQPAATSQTQASGGSAGQMLLRMVQGPKTHALYGKDRTPSWADAYDSGSEEPGSDCSTADTMHTVERGTILASKTATRAPVSQLDMGINGTQTLPQLGSPELPTVGSRDHHLGACKPCAFHHREGGCESGMNCEFCHLCEKGAKKQRQKEKLALRRLAWEGGMHSSQYATTIQYQ